MRADRAGQYRADYNIAAGYLQVNCSGWLAGAGREGRGGRVRVAGCKEKIVRKGTSAMKEREKKREK